MANALSPRDYPTKQQPRVGPIDDDVEVRDADPVTEVVAVFGNTVLDVQHVGQARHGFRLALAGLVPFAAGIVRRAARSSASYTLGESPRASFPTAVDGAAGDFALVGLSPSGATRLRFTSAMTGGAVLEGRTLTLADLVRSGRANLDGGAYAVVLPAGARCHVDHRGLRFHVSQVARARSVVCAAGVDKPFWLYNAASLAVIGTLVGLAHLIPPADQALSLDDPAGDSRFAAYFLTPDVVAEDDARVPAGGTTRESSGGGGRATIGDAGAMGDPSERNPAGQHAIKRRTRAVALARDFDPDVHAREAGILGMMQTASGYILASPDGATFASGDHDADVWGSLTGTEIGTAFGVVGGLGPVGVGRGGGGDAHGTVGLGRVGLISRDGGGFTCSSPERASDPGCRGRQGGTGFGARVQKRPRVRQATADVRGPIDKEVIRRVVRNHINEVRHCYNQGLASDPNLKGRVAVQFSIGPAGRVPMAVVEESSIADDNVGQCIAAAVRRWRFPGPEGGGNVIVTYPFQLDLG